MPLVLGSIVFKDLEIPGHLNFGTSQMTAVHKLLGGQRVVDAMGPDDHPPQWAGRFQGPDATVRARALVALAGSGAKVPLVFGSFMFLVLVDDAECNFQRWYQIPYHVSCTVVSSPFGGAFVAPPLSFDTLVSNDLASVSALVDQFTAGVP